MSDLPAGWTTVALGDHLEILSGFAFPAKEFSSSGSMPVIRIRDVVRGRTETYYDGEWDPRFLVQPGELLIGMDGDFNRERWKSEPALLNQRVCKVTANGKTLDQSFLYHLLRPVLQDIWDSTSYATVKHLSAKRLREATIPLPPLNEQRRIAKILDTATALSERAAEAMRAATSFAASLFRQMFGTPAHPQGNAAVAPFGELLKVSSGQFLPASAMNPDGAHPVYGGNGQNGVHNEYLFDESKVVIGRVGAYCGAVHVTEPKSWVSDNALYVKSTSHPLVPQFLALSLQQANLNQYANQSGQPSISAKKLARVPILVAPQSDQDDFEKRLSAFRAIETGITSRMTETTNLASSLQSRAFRGEL